MKRLGWILVLVMAASPAWAARKVNILQLKDLLVSLHEAKKNDAEVAAELEQIELTEQLSRSTMNVLNDYIPGQSSTEQFFVLEARSAACRRRPQTFQRRLLLIRPRKKPSWIRQSTTSPRASPNC